MFTLSGEGYGESATRGFAQPADTALMLSTSGTTASPKLVPLTHANICASALSMAANLKLGHEDRCLSVMPLYHIHGLIGAALSTLVAGGSMVCPPGFGQSAFFACLAEFCPSWYTAAPAIHHAILSSATEHGDIITRCPLRFIRSCSAPLPSKIMEDLERVFGAPVIEAYGMTEASHQICSNPLPPRSRKVGSVGVPTGCELAIMDEAGNILPPEAVGEIVIRGPNVARGYEGTPPAHASAVTNGWFRTGDQGAVDRDGYVFIKGRLKEIINRGGTKIPPGEVEDVLLGHPAIAQAVVFGIPHRTLGEDVAAAVVLREHATAGEVDIRRFAATRLADFRVPSRVLIVDDIPSGRTGKLQRSKLADAFTPLLKSPFVTPSRRLERELAKIWASVLSLQRVGIHDNFFELGGSSLSAVRMFGEVEKMTGRSLPVTTLIRAPTVQELIEVLNEDGSAGPWPSLVAIQPRGSRPPFFCVHDVSGSVLAYRHLARHLGADQPFYALQQQGIDGVHPPHTRIEDMAAHYVQEIRTFLPEGPYLLGGQSFGGLVAYEVARQLLAQGQRVGLLALIDTHFPNRSPAQSDAGSPGSAVAVLLRRIQFHVDNLSELGLRGMPRHVMQGLAARISRGVSKFLRVIPQPPPPTAQTSPDAYLLRPVLRELAGINRQATKDYVPPPYPGRVTVLLARRLTVFDRDDPRLPERLAGGGVERHKISGDHTNNAEEPHVRSLAKKLRGCLDRAIASSSRA
jgi:oxalate---CoA ligase